MRKSKQKGFIKMIIIIIIALVILQYAFHISLKDIINSQIVQQLWSIIQSIFNLLWQAIVIIFGYIREGITYAQNYLNTVPKASQ